LACVDERVVADGRLLLREVLAAPLRFTPDGKTYRFTAAVATGELIAGAVLPTKGTSPTGSVREWTREVPGEVKAA
jgi:hypothetical protein